MPTTDNPSDYLSRDTVQITIAPDFLIKYNPSRKRVLQLIAAGWSNSSIAQDLNFSTKNIESITTMLIRLAKIHSVNGNLNPRARLVAKCYHAGKIKYIGSQEPPNELLSVDQVATLLLVSAGLSNNTTGRILGISEKTVESRLNNLFLQFAINAKANKIINPRMRLIAVANARQNITFEAFQEIWLKTNSIDLEQIIANPQELREMLFRNANKLLEDAPKYRDNAHKQRQLVQPQPQIMPPHSQRVYTRLNQESEINKPTQN